MPSGQSSTSFAAHRTLILALLVTVGMFVGTRCLEASEGASPDEKIKPSDISINRDEPGEITHEQKKSYLRTLARIWLPILLLLVIFVVVLMVVSRRLRLWVLGRWRSVKFDPVEDLWWKKDEKNEK